MAEEILIGTASRMILGRGVLDAATVLDGVGERSCVAVLTQSGPSVIARSVARSIRSAGLRAEVRVLPDGEAAKDLHVAAEIYAWLNDLGLSRLDTVIGVGGGTVTDLSGFVAATYLRGVESILVTTTLLGAVDASIGGKTGVNLGGKNLVGAFHHPTRVIVDADVLDALPIHLTRLGAAEALKTGLIADPALVDLYERDGLGADVEEVVRRSIAVKAGVVERDPTEQGERAILNYGHTIGHGVESALGLEHGNAVAIGMVAAGAASRIETGFAGEERQRSIIESLGLPIAAPDASADAVRSYLRLDKKRDGDGLRMVLLEDIGAPVVRHIGSATVDAALDSVGIQEDS